MRWLKELARRLTQLGQRRRFEDDLAEEIEFHIEARAEELEQSGVTRGEAIARARREFGSMARAREETRGVSQIRWLEDLVADLGYAGRAFRRNPGFVFVAVLSLALGIGANTTIFSLTMEFLFSPPSCQRPETLAAMRIGGGSHAPMREYRFLRDANLFEGLAGSNEDGEVNWRHGDETQRLHAMRVTDNFFDVAGIPMAMGRPIKNGDRNVAVLNYYFWQRRLAGNPDIVGRLLVLDGQAYTVVGVLPRGHRTLIGLGFSPELYLPVSNEGDIVALVARLPEGMSRPLAAERLKPAIEELDQVYPREFGRRSQSILVSGVTGFDRLASTLGPSAWIPLAAFFGMLIVVVGLVVLIACANVASLLLARASSRRQEIAIRLAIGAGRSRIVRQLLAESLLLALLGTIAGLVLNLWLTGFMNRIPLALPVPIQLQIAPDWRLLSYAIGLALMSALLCGLMPALKATRADVNVALKQHERQVGSGRWNMRNAMVAGQLAVTMVLLTAGFLFLRNLMTVTSMSLGFDVDRTVWAYMRLLPERYAAPEKTQALISAALERLRAVPGVEAASIAKVVPLNDTATWQTDARTDLDDHPVRVRFHNNWVSPDYFRTMGIPILAGREFGASELGVVILDENLARRLFGKMSPIGHTVTFLQKKPVTVIGVARNSKYFTLAEENAQGLYAPYGGFGSIVNLHFMVRSSRPPETLIKEMNTALGALDRSAALEIKPMRNAMFLALLPSRAGAALLGSLGALGLLLAAIGLYGVLVYAVSRRIREIGVRVALGAAPSDILRMVFGESLLLVGIGMAIGLVIAVFATRPLAMFLVPELSPTDPAAFVAVVAMLGAVSFAATLGPALRALRVDPMVALRWE